MKNERRIEGAILGAILGDCIANPYLFCSSEDLIRRRFDIGWEVHPMSDESQLLLLGLTAVKKRGLRLEALVKAYHTWVRSNPDDLDHVMSAVFGAQKAPSLHELWSISADLDFGASGSSALLSRQIPIVLTAWRLEDEPRLFRRIDEATRLTHIDERTREICQLYALTLAMCLRGESRLHIWNALQSRVQTAATRALLVDSYYQPPKQDGPDYNSNRVAIQRALFELWHSNNFVASIRSCILGGGGTDMNAAAVGALLGAFAGRESLPLPWLDTLMQIHGAPIDEALAYALAIANRSHRARASFPEGNSPVAIADAIATRPTRPTSSASWIALAKTSRRIETEQAKEPARRDRRDASGVCENA